MLSRGGGGGLPAQQNFWIPQHTPSYKADQLQAPESRLVDPMDSEQPLKVKRPGEAPAENWWCST